MTPPDQALRADAKRNRDRIVQVAREALRTTGDVSLNAIAKTAGVGSGTLYRHFANRDALLIEVYREEIRDLVDQVAPLLAEHPPLVATRMWFEALAEAMKTKQGLGDALTGSTKQTVTSESYGPVVGAIRALLDAGEATGEVRPGLDVDDVLLLLGALWRVPPGAEGDEQGERLMSLILRSIAA
ncbi:TetR/AcrR family transcriptional regulator [Frondihabitans australicus]|uniref:TetR family transcriptional regulator n=1 Tax=Frondihabitans australicus TaxID=386892 RepID=A0A495IG19_9MICO|nr:TetR family transcriptional regulator [Frondihabitans australicus]RKR74947.1 TetR family transcriptional regulator [Frondihabitans australicus]